MLHLIARTFFAAHKYRHRLGQSAIASSLAPHIYAETSGQFSKFGSNRVPARQRTHRCILPKRPAYTPSASGRLESNGQAAPVVNCLGRRLTWHLLSGPTMYLEFP